MQASRIRAIPRKYWLFLALSGIVAPYGDFPPPQHRAATATVATCAKADVKGSMGRFFKARQGLLTTVVPNAAFSNIGHTDSKQRTGSK
jgi:hypothetical protein